MKKPNIIKLGLLVVATATTTLLCPSCAKEAATEEPAPLRITLTLPGDAAQPYGNFDLLAFDRDGYFAGRWQGEGEINISLEKGRYTLIACSAEDEFALSPEIMVEGETALGGVTIRPCADGAALYMGAAQDVMPDGSQGQTLKINLTRNDGLAIGVELAVWGMIRSSDMDL